MPFSRYGVGQFGGISIRTRIRRTLPEDFSRHERLQMGPFGLIFRYKDEKSGEDCALKLISDLRLDYKSRASLEYYESVHRSVDHENIIRFRESFSAKHYRCYMYDLVDGRDLIDAIINFETYTLMDAKNCIADILKAVIYCHERDIILRNLHPRCFLWHNTGIGSGKVVLIDVEKAIQAFGMKLAKFGNVSKFKYRAPEVIRGWAHRKSADVWACGVIFFNLLTGVYPYNAIDQKKMLQDIDKNRKNPVINDLKLPRATMTALSSMLFTNISRRFTARYALKMCCYTERGDPNCNDMPLDRQKMKEYLGYMLRRHITPSIIERCSPDFAAAKCSPHNYSEIVILRNGKPMPMIDGVIYPRLHGRSTFQFSKCNTNDFLSPNPEEFIRNKPSRVKLRRSLSFEETGSLATAELESVRYRGFVREVHNDANVYRNLIKQRERRSELEDNASMP